MAVLHRLARETISRRGIHAEGRVAAGSIDAGVGHGRRRRRHIGGGLAEAARRRAAADHAGGGRPRGEGVVVMDKITVPPSVWRRRRDLGALLSHGRGFACVCGWGVSLKDSLIYLPLWLFLEANGGFIRRA